MIVNIITLCQASVINLESAEEQGAQEEPGAEHWQAEQEPPAAAAAGHWPWAASAEEQGAAKEGAQDEPVAAAAGLLSLGAEEEPPAAAAAAPGTPAPQEGSTQFRQQVRAAEKRISAGSIIMWIQR